MALTLSTPKTPYQLEALTDGDVTILRIGNRTQATTYSVATVQTAIQVYARTCDIRLAFGHFPVYVVEFILDGLYDGKGSLTYELDQEPTPA